MNKKGDVHVDWIISMGIFIIAVIALLTFFNPIDTKEVDKDLLIERLIDNFDKDFTWEIKISHLFVGICKGATNPSPPPSIVASSVNFNLENSWIVSKVSYSDSDGNINVNLGTINSINCDKTDEISENIASNEFHIEGLDNAVFFILYKNGNVNPGRANFKVICNPALGDNANCQFSLGVPQSFIGVNEGWISQLEVGQYDINNIKTTWNFPNANDFWIESADLNINFKTADPYEQTDVVVRELKIFKVDDQGNKEPVTIIFRVW